MNGNPKAGSAGLTTPDELWTLASFGTLGGCTVIAWVVTSVVCGVFKLPPSPAGLFVSIIVAIAGASFAPEKRLQKYVVAVFNGFLIYLTVIGGTAFTPLVNPRTTEEVSRPSLLKPWIPDRNFVQLSARQAASIRTKDQAIQNKESELRDKTRAFHGLNAELDLMSSALAQPQAISGVQKMNLQKRIEDSKRIIRDTGIIQ